VNRGQGGQSLLRGTPEKDFGGTSGRTIREAVVDVSKMKKGKVSGPVEAPRGKETSTKQDLSVERGMRKITTRHLPVGDGQREGGGEKFERVVRKDRTR